MRRLLLAAIALFVCLPASAQGARPAACWPKGSTTLSLSQHARVFEVRTERTVQQPRYACLFSTARAYGLDTIGDTAAEPPFALAGRYLAFPGVARGQDGTMDGMTINVRDLRTGRGVLFDNMFEGFVDWAEVPPDFRIVLRRTGGVAWLGTGYDFSRSRKTTQVQRADSRGRRLLAEGDDLTDLKFCDGARVCWKQVGVTHRASLR